MLASGVFRRRLAPLLSVVVLLGCGDRAAGAGGDGAGATSGGSGGAQSTSRGESGTETSSSSDSTTGGVETETDTACTDGDGSGFLDIDPCQCPSSSPVECGPEPDSGWINLGLAVQVSGQGFPVVALDTVPGTSQTVVETCVVDQFLVNEASVRLEMTCTEPGGRDTARSVEVRAPDLSVVEPGATLSLRFEGVEGKQIEAGMRLSDAEGPLLFALAASQEELAPGEVLPGWVPAPLSLAPTAGCRQFDPQFFCCASCVDPSESPCGEDLRPVEVTHEGQSVTLWPRQAREIGEYRVLVDRSSLTDYGGCTTSDPGSWYAVWGYRRRAR